MEVIKKISTRLKKLVFTITCLLTVYPDLSAITHTDGPVRMTIRVHSLYIYDYLDAGFGVAEPIWKIAARDNPNLDGQDWMGGQCINSEGRCSCSGWFGIPGGFGNLYWIYDYTFTGSNVPGGFDIRLEAWEDDGCGSECTYDTGTFCDNDDEHCGQTIVKVNEVVRTARPCEWHGAGNTVNQYDYFACSNKYAVGIEWKWEYTTSPSSTTYYWRGHYSDNWYDACNWSTSSVPTSSKNVIISTGYTYSPIVYAGNAYCNTIEIVDGAHLEIKTDQGGVLNVTKP